MAFSFANVAAAAGGEDSSIRIMDGPDLQEITTDQLGFTAINGDAKVRLLPDPWPADNLPSPSSSLLTIASSQGLVVAAGPSCLVVVTSSSVRETMKDQVKDKIRSIKPLLTIPHQNTTHVAFLADDSALVVATPSQGMTAYRAELLRTGSANPALTIAINSQQLRALVPNPAIQSAQFIACVTNGGELLLADLSTGLMVEASNGPVLAQNVSCMSWSKQGKQIVAGLADGTAIQLKPDGTLVAKIPKSTSVSDDVHISAICWLETNSFFVIYTPNSTDTSDGIPSSDYYIISRQDNQYTFQKLPEILLPQYESDRVPTHHFISRLRDWKPNLTDLLVISSSTASEIGMISKADKGLSTSDMVTDSFTLTVSDDDTKRAALPLSEDQLDTSPIGMALDLSATAGVVNPIPSDPEIEESPGPVPNLLVLNNDGVLSSWWIIYADSIRQKTSFSGFATLDKMVEARSAVAPPAQESLPTSTQVDNEQETKPQSVFATPKSTFGLTPTSPFATPASSLGMVTSQSAFGTSKAFGPSTAIGESKNSWTNTGFDQPAVPIPTPMPNQSAFGTPSFGNASSINVGSTAPAFGAAGALGNRPSPFSTSGSSGAATFGRPGFDSKPNAGSFSSTAAASPFSAAKGASGFASFAQQGTFSSFGASKKDGDQASPFAKSPFGGAAFGQNTSTTTPFGAADNSKNSFGGIPAKSSFTGSSMFGDLGSSLSNSGPGSTSFKLGSSFKGDGSSKDDLPKPTNGAGFAFGSAFDDLLGGDKAKTTQSRDKEEAMEDREIGEVATEHEHRLESQQNQQSLPMKQNLVTPPSTISQTKSTPAPAVSTLFGSKVALPFQTPQSSVGTTGFSFGAMPATFSTNHEVRNPATVTALQAQKTPEPRISKEDRALKVTTESPSDDDTVKISKLPESPPSPSASSKQDHQPRDAPESSLPSQKSDDAPLPSESTSSKPLLTTISPTERPAKAHDDSSVAGFAPANRSAVSEKEEPLPLKGQNVVEVAEKAEDEDEQDGEDDEDSGFSSDFVDSGDEVTENISPADGSEDHGEGTAGDLVQTSPESSFRGENTTSPFASPTGEPFTKVSAARTQPQLTRPPLFGEIGSAPVFPPPKPQESPRSPSPVRQPIHSDILRPDLRAVSAPVPSRSAIDQRKAEYMQSAIAAKAMQVREEEAIREKARLDALQKSRDQAYVSESQILEDDEDDRIQHELSLPIGPVDTLDPFITYESVRHTKPTKTDIPGQIECLYQDINSIVYTLGINARSLSSFLLYQKGQNENRSWPAILQSDTPMDVLNDEWLLQDINRLGEGCTTLERSIEQHTVYDMDHNLDFCQTLLTGDMVDLRHKIVALRKSIHARSHHDPMTAPLSAEQTSIQSDLRRVASAVQSNLMTIEDNLSVLRARLSDVAPVHTNNGWQNAAGEAAKKPTVEAITNTIIKMTGMAEKRSADVDVLEAQLKRLSVNRNSTAPPMTPPRRGMSLPATPGSASSSIYHTPGSQLNGSTRSTRHLDGSAKKGAYLAEISAEDRQRWHAKNKRRRDVAAALQAAIEHKRAAVA